MESKPAVISKKEYIRIHKCKDCGVVFIVSMAEILKVGIHRCTGCNRETQFLGPKEKK
jgi:hypothetical protein